MGTKAVGVVLHPFEEASGRLIRIGAGRLPGLDPAAVKLGDKLAEASARVVDLRGLLVAACEEGLVESHGLGGCSRDEFREFVLDGPELADKGEGGVVGDETSWLERRLDQALHLAYYVTTGPLHRRPRFVLGLGFAVGGSSPSKGIALKPESSPW